MTRGKQRYNRKPGSFDRFTSAQINGEGKKLLDQEPLSRKMTSHWLDREEKMQQPNAPDRILQRKIQQQQQQRHAALTLEYQRLLRQGIEKGLLLPD